LDDQHGEDRNDQYRSQGGGIRELFRRREGDRLGWSAHFGHGVTPSLQYMLFREFPTDRKTYPLSEIPTGLHARQVNSGKRGRIRLLNHYMWGKLSDLQAA
jgi:hypothetical protein